MEAVCLAVNFCFLKRKEPLGVVRNNAVLAMVPQANGHRGAGLGPCWTAGSDESDMCWSWMARRLDMFF